MLAQTVAPDALAEACGPDPSFICREVLERTDSAALAELADIVFAKPLTIALIIAGRRLVVIALVRPGHRPLRRRHDRRAAAEPAAQAPAARARRSARRLPDGVLDTGACRSAPRPAAETLGARAALGGRRSRSGRSPCITILGELGINLGPLIAGAGIAGVAIGFGAQSLVKDFLAGIFMLVEDQYGVGDIVDVGEAHRARSRR